MNDFEEKLFKTQGILLQMFSSINALELEETDQLRQMVYSVQSRFLHQVITGLLENGLMHPELRKAIEETLANDGVGDNVIATDEGLIGPTGAQGEKGD